MFHLATGDAPWTQRLHPLDAPIDVDADSAGGYLCPLPPPFLDPMGALPSAVTLAAGATPYTAPTPKATTKATPKAAKAATPKAAGAKATTPKLAATMVTPTVVVTKETKRRTSDAAAGSVVAAGCVSKRHLY